MRSLRALGEHVGIPQDSGGYGTARVIGLAYCDQLLATTAPARSRRSLAGLIRLIPTLAPLTLEARLLNPEGREEDYFPTVRVSASASAVISTRMHYFQGGREFGPSRNFGAAGGDLRDTQLGPGEWQIQVRRAGIDAVGFHRLQKAFRASVKGAKKPPPPPPPPLERPVIEVTPTRSGAHVNLHVHGRNFLPDQPASREGVTIRVTDAVRLQDWLMVWTGSGSDRRISHSVGPIDLRQLQPNALGQRVLAVQATDKRRDPSSVPAGEPLWSNTVTLTF